jgi:hypothetical protein
MTKHVWNKAMFPAPVMNLSARNVSTLGENDPIVPGMTVNITDMSKAGFLPNLKSEQEHLKESFNQTGVTSSYVYLSETCPITNAPTSMPVM